MAYPLLGHLSNPKKKETLMADDRTNTGLCMNCLNAQQCAYRIRHPKPVIFCEEFTCKFNQANHDVDASKRIALAALGQEPR